jgi:hypothetical protein
VNSISSLLENFLHDDNHKKIYKQIFNNKLELSLHRPWDCKITVSTTNYKYRNNKNFSLDERKFIKDYLQDMRDRDFISPSKEVKAAPLLLVPKKNGQLRLCIDYRSLNNVTIKEGNSFPNIENLMLYLGQKTVFF